MLGHLFMYFVIGLFVGILFSGYNYKYYHAPLGYLVCFFLLTVFYAFVQRPIDAELFLFPLVYFAGIVIALKGRNKIS